MLAAMALFMALLCATGWWGWVLLMALATTCTSLCVLHDANHGSLSSVGWINWAGSLSGDLVGASSILWRHQHVITHHIYTNDPDQDCDVFSSFPFIRFHEDQEWAPHH